MKRGRIISGDRVLLNHPADNIIEGETGGESLWGRKLNML
jgi:hypothetical protein